MTEKPESIPIKEVEELPEVANEKELIFNKADGSFYIGMETGKEKKNGDNLEKTSV